MTSRRLKLELTSYHAVIPVKAKIYPFSFLPIVLMVVVASFSLLTSHARAVVLVAAIAALGLQAVGVCSVLHTWRAKTKPKFLVLMHFLTWLLIAGFVFHRVKSAW
jgi:hypothetical protein